MANNIKITGFSNQDLKKVMPLLQDWVVDPESGEIDHDRIERILTLIQVEPKNAGDRIYLVAKDNKSTIIGMIGYKAPCSYMQSFCETNRAAEIINFYTADHFKDHNTAGQILDFVEKEVKKEGGREIVLNRAPRYAKDVDAFMKTKPEYKPVGVAEDFFGESFDAPVWVKKIKR